jgi:adenine-specific DNA-methyltransferase
MEEVLGEENFVSEITISKTTGLAATGRVASSFDFILWFAKSKKNMKYRELKNDKSEEALSRFSSILHIDGGLEPLSEGRLNELESSATWCRVVTDTDLTKPGPGAKYEFLHQGKIYTSGSRWWGTQKESLGRVAKTNRLMATKSGTLRFLRSMEDSPGQAITNSWMDIGGAVQSRSDPKIYIVQTGTSAVQRCVLMTTDPGDLVLDPTCGSGTSATVSEQWGRRWITIDTSRVALALARARVMSAKYPYYLLADSTDGQSKEAELTGKPPPDVPVNGDIRQGFVYNRAPHITLKSIANNSEIDVIWTDYQEQLEPLRNDLNDALDESWEEWEIPRVATKSWSENVKGIHKAWWELRIERQEKIDESIAKKADVELLYDRPYEDKTRVRVAGPFTVESLSPHRVVPSSEMELADESDANEGSQKHKLPQGTEESNDFTAMILEHLESAGVQQAKKEDRIDFTSIAGWPGTWIAADGRFMEGEAEKRAAIFIGPEFGTVSRADLTAAAREALDARFDVLIACGFNFEAHTSELNKLGPLPILKAKMNPELHMSDELKNTGAGNLFVVFGEPDIEWEFNDEGEIVVEVLGVDVFDPKTGDVRASGKDDIAAWFIDTDYNEESFFVRHAYFMGANDPYKSLKTALKAEIDEEAWATLYRDTSRPFPRPETGRFAVKVINHFGDEVMKVFAV